MSRERPQSHDSRASEADQLRLLIDSIVDHAICMLDATGVVTTWNLGAERVTGYAARDMIGRLLSVLFSQRDQSRSWSKNILEIAATSGSYEDEGWMVRQDGGRFWALAVVYPARDTAGAITGYTAVIRDMTVRKQAQDAAIEGERRFRILVEGVADYAIYMLDPSGLVTNWNTGAARIKGYTAAEVVGRHFSMFYTPADRAAGRPMKALEIAAREGKFEAEGRRVRKDGSQFWASVLVDAIRDDKGELIGFAKVTRDITERQIAQDALRESERQFRLLVGGVTDYAIYMIDPNGVVSNWNAGAARIKGYTADEIVGQHFSRFYTEADRNNGLPLRGLREAAEHGRFEAEGWRVRKDGTRFWANVVIDALREDGQLIGFAKITRDITERKRAAEALERAREHLAQTQKMEALGQITGGVAHDFNNLLMVVAGQASMLKRRLQDPRDLHSLRAIEKAVSHGSGLTQQLLAFGRATPINPEAVNVAQRIPAASRDLLLSLLPKGVDLSISIPPNIWPIFVDARELDLALVNLVVNARDALPTGGKVAITAHNSTITEPQVDGLQGDYVVLDIEDTGTGIPPEHLSRIFEPFYTTKAPGKGTGLGLAQVYGFGRQSGGIVRVRSEVGRGTTFTIFIPRAPDDQRKADEGQEDRAEAEAKETGHVLVVEDNEDVARVSTALIEQMGYTVTLVPTADEALTLIQRNPNFDLVFSDVVMPGQLDGLALARTIKRSFPQIPVLLTSGYAKATDSVEPDFTILRKPYEVKALAAAVRQTVHAARRRRD